MENSKKTKPSTVLVDKDGNDHIVTPRKLVVVSQLTYCPECIENFEHPEGESMTIPDMSMSIQQILTRYAQTGTLLGFESEYYDDEFPDVAKMDLVDLQEAREQVQAELDYMNSLILDRQKEADAEAARLAAEQAKKQAKLDKLLEDQPE